MENNSKGLTVTTRKCVKVVALFLFIIVFCPAFLVSCSGKNVKVSANDAFAGMYVYGDKVSEPHALAIFFFIIPMLIFIVLFIKRFSAKAVSAVIAVMAVIDCIMWVTFKHEVKKAALENYCEFKVTAWYALDISLLLLVIVVSLLCCFNMLDMDKDLLSGALGSNNSNVVGFCSRCGAPLEADCRFCESCGSPIAWEDPPVPEAEIPSYQTSSESEMAYSSDGAYAETDESVDEFRDAPTIVIGPLPGKEQSERTMIYSKSSNAPKEVEEGTFCQYCGHKMNVGAMFCVVCGKKANQ